MVIYKILNQLNGKVYIGQTTRTLEQRWKNYIKDLLTERIFYIEEEIAKALGTTKSYILKILLGKIKSEKYCIEKLPITKIKVPKKCKVNDLVLKKYKYLITPCLD